jgi:hypothetical protein
MDFFIETGLPELFATTRPSAGSLASAEFSRSRFLPHPNPPAVRREAEEDWGR